jgi:hypothetical protein
MGSLFGQLRSADHLGAISISISICRPALATDPAYHVCQGVISGLIGILIDSKSFKDL